MNKLIIAICFLLSGCVVTYNKRLLDRIEKTETRFYNDRNLNAEKRIELFNFDDNDLSSLVICSVNDERKRRYRPLLEQDSLFNQIALTVLKIFNRKTFVHSPTWRKEKSAINYVLQRLHAKHKAYSAHVFLLDMLDLPFSTSFYCDKKNGNSPINLYKGKKPKVINPNDVNYVEPEALYAITEKQFSDRLLSLLSKGGYSKDLLSKKFSCIGVALKMDTRSLNKNVRPKIFVVLIFGGKVLQNIKLPSDLIEESYSP